MESMAKDVAKPGDTTEFINASAGQESALMGLKASYRRGLAEWACLGNGGDFMEISWV